MFKRAFVALLISATAFAQTTYMKPPQNIVDVLNAPAPPLASVSPARDVMLLATPLRYPPIADVAAQCYDWPDPASIRRRMARIGRNTLSRFC
jgi:hypothetical protein